MDDLLMMAFTWVMQHSWSQYILAAFVVLKALTQFVPSTWQGKWWYNYPMKAVNFFIMNNGKNKNADDKPIKVANVPVG